ncbi:hypothetical protein MGYG_00976 [Nannizzia gypsea CBS 118893]|uniref:Secreted protein n=1 Tax=Arthroderma gypseum (strain ATCC MYA-4604 / CBS 118893) TaxID=535722 RepID=E5R3C5_ARTGP|nr:hypothetical protein MGYG_00976 [Nannizzia gypsea CBS 118893]EFQ97940.1 hypothetical protein MGYG_00976 [Nannizzia gypsea CBS 118893]
MGSGLLLLAIEILDAIGRAWVRPGTGQGSGRFAPGLAPGPFLAALDTSSAGEPWMMEPKKTTSFAAVQRYTPLPATWDPITE